MRMMMCSSWAGRKDKFMPKAAIFGRCVPLVIDCFSGTRVLARAPTCLLSNKETASFLWTINHLISYGYMSIRSTAGGHLFPIAESIGRDCSI
jgi:hypothetical protein